MPVPVAHRRRIRYAVEASLRRLRTDRIDIYYVHRFDDRTALEETLGALDDLVHQGKVVYLGASNLAAWQVVKALGISAKAGLTLFSCIQPMYNLVKRQAESEILPMAQSEGLGVFPYSPLGGGLLKPKDKNFLVKKFTVIQPLFLKVREPTGLILVPHLQPIKQI